MESELEQEQARKLDIFETRENYPWSHRRKRWPLLTKETPVVTIIHGRTERTQIYEICDELSSGYVFLEKFSLTAIYNASDMRWIHRDFHYVLDALFTRLWSLDFLVQDLDIPRTLVRIIDEFSGVQMTTLLARPSTKTFF